MDRRAKRKMASSRESLTREDSEGVLMPQDSIKYDDLGWRSCLTAEPLLVATLVGVVCGITLGLLLKLASPSAKTVDLIGFPGELMLRLLKMLVLPLVAVSMVSGVCALQQSGGGQGVRRLARLTFAYYTVSTLAAIVLGIALVQLIRPGRNAPLDSLTSASASGCHRGLEHKAAGPTPPAAVPQLSTIDALMNVGREVLPDNVVSAAVNMNILGIITFSLMFGIALSSIGSAADSIIEMIAVLNAAVGKMVTAALWVSPVGIGSLIAASILRACDLLGTLSALALWAATVVVGLAIFALVLLPAALYLVTGMSPLRATAAYAQALLMAFGTSSSAASLPLAMKTSIDLGVEEGTVSFFLPLGCTVNMNGTALYEATTAIFIAQAHGVYLGLAELLIVAFTASLAAIGAPAIPSAGLVTMLIVLQAVNLGQYASDLAIILSVDWLLDRIRTIVNLMSDVFGVLMIDHVMQHRKWREGGLGLGAANGGVGAGGVDLAEGPSGPNLQVLVEAEERWPQQEQRALGMQQGGGALAGRRVPGYVQLQEMHGQEPKLFHMVFLPWLGTLPTVGYHDLGKRNKLQQYFADALAQKRDDPCTTSPDGFGSPLPSTCQLDAGSLLAALLPESGACKESEDPTSPAAVTSPRAISDSTTASHHSHLASCGTTPDSYGGPLARHASSAAVPHAASSPGATPSASTSSSQAGTPASYSRTSSFALSEGGLQERVSGMEAGAVDLRYMIQRLKAPRQTGQVCSWGWEHAARMSRTRRSMPTELFAALWASTEACAGRCHPQDLLCMLESWLALLQSCPHHFRLSPRPLESLVTYSAPVAVKRMSEEQLGQLASLCAEVALHRCELSASEKGPSARDLLQPLFALAAAEAAWRCSSPLRYVSVGTLAALDRASRAWRWKVVPYRDSRQLATLKVATSEALALLQGHIPG